MSTAPETVEYILDCLGDRKLFTVRAMFGEFALYAEGKVVALVCDDLLYVKILPESKDLADTCETDAPYPGAKLHYVVSEDQLLSLEDLPRVLLDIAASLPEKKKKSAKKVARRRG